MTEPPPRGDSVVGPMDRADDNPPRDERFRALYRAEFGFVWAVARRFGVPPAALDDIAQDVFLAAFRRLDSLRFEVSPRSWLFSITRRVASRYHRGASRLDRRHAALAELAPTAIDGPHARHEAAQRLEQLLAPLPRGTRAVWELTEVLGMSGPEIAAELELPLNTVYSRLRLARAQLLALSTAPEAIATCVESVRRRDAPPADAAPRNWALILPILGPGGHVAAIASAWTTSRAAMAVTLFAATTAVVTAVVPAGARSSAPPPPTPPAISRNMSLETSTAPPAAEPPPAPEPEPPPRPVSTQAHDRLAAEVALIDRARAHLSAGDADAALARLAEHAREFPRGSLLDAREAARIDALCQQGLPAAANIAARRLTTQLPESLIARRYQHFVCPS